MQSAISMLLAGLLVFNAGCACAAVMDDMSAGLHEHHQQSDHTHPGPADCSDYCENAVGVLPGKDAVKPASYKFGLDDIEWIAGESEPAAPAGLVEAAGPLRGLFPPTSSTPVLRFDLQLE